MFHLEPFLTLWDFIFKEDYSDRSNYLVEPLTISDGIEIVRRNFHPSHVEETLAHGHMEAGGM